MAVLRALVPHCWLLRAPRGPGVPADAISVEWRKEHSVLATWSCVPSLPLGPRFLVCKSGRPPRAVVKLESVHGEHAECRSRVRVAVQVPAVRAGAPCRAVS